MSPYIALYFGDIDEGRRGCLIEEVMDRRREDEAYEETWWRGVEGERHLEPLAYQGDDTF
jgi:hypothetical protein